ncbi:MAG: dual specificity protein phosphatase family protein [Methylotenera sp.]|nr:dual specificity protein phosphatase family protein [Oligoflexia bacterium]
MKIKLLFLSVIMTVSSAFNATTASAKNLHQVDEDSQSGYAMYRTGKPNLRDFKEICALGITQMIVLSGDADKAELKYRDQYCPQLEILYNEKQTVKVALTTGFLKQFDEWVKVAKEKGIKIAFRCDCGCHRTGRLAAYYEMKYMGASSDAAIRNMKALGKWMFLYPHLKNQVWALSNYIHGEPCSQSGKYCVTESLFTTAGSSSSYPEYEVATPYTAEDGINDPADQSDDGAQELQDVEAG